MDAGTATPKSETAFHTGDVASNGGDRESSRSCRLPWPARREAKRDSGFMGGFMVCARRTGPTTECTPSCTCPLWVKSGHRTPANESRLALHGASSGGAAMIALKSHHICGEIGGGGLDYPRRRLARRPPSAIG